MLVPTPAPLAFTFSAPPTREPEASQTPLPEETPAPTPTPQEEETMPPTATPTLEPTKAPVKQPPLLQKYADSLGIELESTKYSQLILVAAKGNACKLYAYERDQAGAWKKFLTADGHLGKNGTTSAKKEGDGCTPLGVYAFGTAFGNDAKPEGMQYPFREVTKNSHFVDDPDSAYYNTWAEDVDAPDWSSSEKLWTYAKAYALAAVVEYNTDPIVKGAGSAIFMHVGSGTTAGCVAAEKSVIRDLLCWFDEAKVPHIWITDALQTT